MSTNRRKQLQAKAQAVLRRNDRGSWTVPAPGLYPHQWLWDSCFIAIGLRHQHPERAALELSSLFRGQWSSGMLPHMIYSGSFPARLDGRFWNAGRWSPPGVITSPLTQPPVVALALELVIEKLDPAAGQELLGSLLPGLVRYHEWLYRERDPENSGLVSLIHPWESGLDNTPPWSQTLRSLSWGNNVWGLLAGVRELGRRGQRATASDAARMVTLSRIISHLDFHTGAILEDSPIRIQDVTFNSILIAANESLERLAHLGSYPLPTGLVKAMRATPAALETLWDPETRQYYSHNVRKNELIKVTSVATFMPLLSRKLRPDRVAALLELMNTREQYATRYPLPSVATSSPWYQPRRYWQGPVWINTNWLTARGLAQHGYHEVAAALRQSSLDLAVKSGLREYYHPQTAEGLGAKDFSWSAALVLDFLAE